MVLQPSSQKGKSKSKKNNNTINNNIKHGAKETTKGLDKYFTYGNKNQGDWYVKTRDDIADYSFCEISKAMGMLVKDGTETTFTKPTRPTTNADAIDMMEYKMELERYNKKVNEYKKEKTKVFAIIEGQCSLTVKTKLEHNTNYKTWKNNDDVKQLLDEIKQMSLTKVDVQDEYWTVVQSMKSIMLCQQGQKESLSSFYRHFKNTKDVAVNKLGKLVPMAMVTSANDKDKASDKFLGQLFLDGVDKEQYGKVIQDLNNNHLAGVNKYPNTVEEAYNLLGNYMGVVDKPHYRSGDKGEDTSHDIETSFAQTTGKRIICYKCGKLGHKKPDCPKNDKDEDDYVSIHSRCNSNASFNSLLSY